MAMVGLVACSRRLNAARRLALSCAAASAEARRSSKRLISAPEMKARSPAPFSTIARIAGSRSKASMIVGIAAHISADMALSLAGLLKIIQPIAPSASAIMRSVGDIMRLSPVTAAKIAPSGRASPRRLRFRRAPHAMDSAMEPRDRPSPNFDARPGAGIVDMLILHYTGMRTGAEALARLCDPAAKVSAHYLIEEDGAVWRLVEEAHRAWHAGLSCWRDCCDINGVSIGIELVNP